MLTEISRFVNHLRRRNPTAETYKTYRYHLKKFVDTVLEPHHRQHCHPHEVNLHDVDLFIEQLAEQGLKSSTINRCLTTLSSFYTCLGDEDPSLTSPVLPHRHMLRVPQRLPRAVPQPDVKRLFTVITGIRDRAIFLLMLRSGLRVSEVTHLTMADLFLMERPPRLRIHGKNSKERSVFLSAETAATLKRYLALRPEVESGAVFLTYDQHGIGVRGIQKRLQRYRREAGVHLTAHQLRHNFANNLVLADVPVTSIQKLMGHVWVGTTQNYIAANDSKVKADFVKAAEVLETWR